MDLDSIVLKKKGDEGQLNLEGVKGMKATLSWTSADDFDLALLYQMKTEVAKNIPEYDDRPIFLIYFGNRGNFDQFPFINLDHDAGAGDTVDDGGINEETIRISRFDHLEKIHFLAWDYGAIEAGGGKPSDFGKSDVKMTITTDTNIKQIVSIDTGVFGNVAHVATIDFTGENPTLKNTSNITVLKEFGKFSVLYDLVNR